MKPQLRTAAITIVLAVLAGIGGVWAGRQFFDPAPRFSLHDMVHRELHLTPAQEGEIDALEQRFTARRSVLESEMREANAELAAAIRASETSGPAVTAAVEHFHDAMGALQTETIDHVFAMRAILTPEQRTRFDETIVEALTSEAQ